MGRSEIRKEITARVEDYPRKPSSPFISVTPCGFKGPWNPFYSGDAAFTVSMFSQLIGFWVTESNLFFFPFMEKIQPARNQSSIWAQRVEKLVNNSSCCLGWRLSQNQPPASQNRAAKALRELLPVHVNSRCSNRLIRDKTLPVCVCFPPPPQTTTYLNIPFFFISQLFNLIKKAPKWFIMKGKKKNTLHSKSKHFKLFLIMLFILLIDCGVYFIDY